MNSARWRPILLFVMTLTVIWGVPPYAIWAASPNPAPTPLFAPVMMPHLAPASVKLKDIEAQLDRSKCVEGGMVLVRLNLGGSQAQGSDYRATFGDHSYPFFLSPDEGPGHYQAIVPVAMDTKPQATQISVKGPSDFLISLPFEIISGNYPSEALTVDAKHVNPPKKAMKKIEADGKATSAVYAKVTPHRYWTWPFHFPVDKPPSSPFGSKRTYNGEPRSSHPGMDFRAPMKTPIHAPAGGVIALAQELYFTGNTVMIDHGYGLITLYAHMTKIDVKVGQEVKEGDLLGLSGMTGRATGPHLHWGVVINKTKINPLELTLVQRSANTEGVKK